jgi:hypothetical protein
MPAMPVKLYAAAQEFITPVESEIFRRLVDEFIQYKDDPSETTYCGAFNAGWDMIYVETRK